MDDEDEVRILILDALWREKEHEDVSVILGGLQLHQRVLEYLNEKAFTIGVSSYPPVFKHRVTYSVKQGFSRPLRLEYYRYLVKLLITFWKIVLRHKPHVIYNPGVGWHNDWLALFAKLTGLKVVSYFHHYALPGGKVIYPRSILDLPALTKMCREIRMRGMFPFFKLIDYLTLIQQLKYVDIVFTGTNFGFEQLRRMGRKRDVILTGIGVDLEEFNEPPPPDEEKIWDGLFVGRMAPEKGIYDLLTIWRRVVDVIPNAKLAVVGKVIQPHYDKWMKTIKELKLEGNIVHLGELERRELIKTYYKAKIFVFPSRMEGAGIVIAEAMAAGLPVVAYTLPAYKSLYANAPLIYLCNSLESFSDKIITLLKDDNLRRQGIENRNFALQNFNWERVSERIYAGLMKVASINDKDNI
ncbi:MAG: glycosyltransferase family 4 protein [archaeon YNP-LCB-003-016]|uniref:glycosyltransferase family 4 protein n=1 Tax=Candidatus Culexarchaeum yellowstonense TaxID=2928963 RepID=UPI0026F09DB6|nr:glycosyltransferase family 4 protein [Candidatus Culexarchaeum yellowstonense]MCR6692303.1 glycosyltransferase family 4 protein [Candidatus Culexarchaeum yellowstonense]